MYEAALEVRNTFKAHKDTKPDALFAITIDAIRACDRGQTHRLRKALVAYPHLQQFFDEDELIHHALLHQHAQDLANRIVEQRLEEIEQHIQRFCDLTQATSTSNEKEKKASEHKQNIIRWSQQFRCRNKKHSITGIDAPDGNTYNTPAEEVDAIIQHWEPTFTVKPIDKEALEEILSYAQTSEPTITWQLEKQDFMIVIENTNDTSPGPDGICYKAWRAAGSLAHRHLCALYICRALVLNRSRKTSTTPILALSLRTFRTPLLLTLLPPPNSYEPFPSSILTARSLLRLSLCQSLS